MKYSVKTIFYWSAISALVVSCGDSNREMEIMDLVGKWEDNSQETTFVEQWTANSDESLSGKGYVMSSKDTVFIEYLSIREVNGVLTYFAQVSDHNDGQVIPFGLKDKKDKRMVFENPDHDFPQRIIYELSTDSTLYVYIEGVENGNFRKRKLSFLKKDS